MELVLDTKSGRVNHLHLFLKCERGGPNFPTEHYRRNNTKNVLLLIRNENLLTCKNVYANINYLNVKSAFSVNY